MFFSSELGKGATSEAGRISSANVWWRCAQYFVIASCVRLWGVGLELHHCLYPGMS